MLVFAKASIDPIRIATQILVSCIPCLILLAAASVLGAFVRRRLLPKFKGHLGEWKVNRVLLHGLHSEEYHVLQDLLLPDGRGGQTQIDHVVVSAFGIFVIETKNWDCWIFGGEHDQQWTLTYRHGRKRKIGNPLLQNKGHVQAVSKLLGTNQAHCHNLVFINPISKLKSGPVQGVFLTGLLDHIRSFQDKVFDPAWVIAAVDTLTSASRSGDKQAVAAHRTQVKSRREKRMD